MNRTPLLEVDWFKETGHLAIADVVYVEGIGLCSHQPRLGESLPAGVHRLQDLEGNYHFPRNEQLFEATPEEREQYWRDYK